MKKNKELAEKLERIETLAGAIETLYPPETENSIAVKLKYALTALNMLDVEICGLLEMELAGIGSGEALSKLLNSVHRINSVLSVEINGALKPMEGER